MNETYLIPANSKRSMLIFGLFTPIDLIIAGIGGFLTFILIVTVNASTIKELFLVLLPLIIAAIMLLPIPFHRNLWTFTVNLYNYLSNRRSYYWRGWCMIYGKEGEKERK